MKQNNFHFFKNEGIARCDSIGRANAKLNIVKHRSSQNLEFWFSLLNIYVTFSHSCMVVCNVELNLWNDKRQSKKKQIWMSCLYFLFSFILKKDMQRLLKHCCLIVGLYRNRNQYRMSEMNHHRRRLLHDSKSFNYIEFRSLVLSLPIIFSPYQSIKLFHN